MPTLHSPSGRIRVLPLVALLLAIGAVIMACGSTTDNSGSTTTGTSATSTPAAKHFKVGQQLTLCIG